MIIRKLFSALELQPGDKVVTAATFRDMLVIVTERGEIYQVKGEAHED